MEEKDLKKNTKFLEYCNIFRKVTKIIQRVPTQPVFIPPPPCVSTLNTPHSSYRTSQFQYIYMVNPMICLNFLNLILVIFPFLVVWGFLLTWFWLPLAVMFSWITLSSDCLSLCFSWSHRTQKDLKDVDHRIQVPFSSHLVTDLLNE